MAADLQAILAHALGDITELDRLEAACNAEEARRSGSRSFAAFVKQAWHVIDQAPLKWNKYVEALALHLELVARRRIRRLVGNGPPRNAKSNLFAIMWPAWVWTWDPARKFIYLSYSDDLVTEHSIKCRALIESKWYQETYKPTWRLGVSPESERKDGRNRQDDFGNSAGGRRIASPISAGVTGRGCDILAIDDPLSAEEAGSQAARDKALRVIKQAVNTRFNDPDTGCAVMLMQRVHAEDPSGWAIDAKWQHFCAPMEFDPERRSSTRDVDGELVWEDPRTEPGEPLVPERFSPEVLRQIKLDFGPIPYTAQFNQAPILHAMAGKYFNRTMFKLVDAAPGGDDVVRAVRRWDLASTEGTGKITSSDPDWTVGLKLLLLADGRLCVADIRDGQWGSHVVRKNVRKTAEIDGYEVEVVVPQDPGQAGKDQAAEYAGLLLGFIFSTPRETGDKVVRAGPASAQAQAGQILVVRAPWNERFFQVLEAFPDPAVHDDHVDALAGAVTHLAIPKSDFGMWQDIELE